jgi:PhnB protein
VRQTVTPYLLYEDAEAALAWLSKAFEFTERERIENPDGTVGHAELDVGDGSTIFLGGPGDGYQNPKSAGRTALVYVYVEDVDEHHAQAKDAGAEILEEPADQPYGDRRYAAEDPEGHVWYFATPLLGDG